MSTEVINVIIAFIVSIVIETAIGTIVALIIKKKWEQRQAEKERLRQLEAQNAEARENQRCQVVKDSIHNEIEGMKSDFKTDLKPITEDLDLMKKTMQKDTRRSLRQDADLFLRRGWVSAQEKTEYDELYWCYHNLGKNGVIDDDHDKVMKLPTSKGE